MVRLCWIHVWASPSPVGHLWILLSFVLDCIWPTWSFGMECKFQRGSTKSGHPRIMTLACVFLQTCPPPDFMWFQSWMTVWLCPLVWLDPLNFIFFSALLIFFGTACWQIRQSCQSYEMSVLANIRELGPLKTMIFHSILSACSGLWGLGPPISSFI